jgi:hypothetical protein
VPEEEDLGAGISGMQLDNPAQDLQAGRNMTPPGIRYLLAGGTQRLFCDPERCFDGRTAAARGSARALRAAYL